METELLLKALGEPMRYRIFTLLITRKHCVRSLSKKLGISESAVSQHLKIMRKSGLIYGEKYGHHTHYLPESSAVRLLSDTFSEMLSASLSLSGDCGACHCDMNKEENEK